MTNVFPTECFTELCKYHQQREDENEKKVGGGISNLQQGKSTSTQERKTRKETKKQK
ncbi:hypothetical protein L798_03259 [Zootermopsis nevadensis]|uniref:Uncharacterized protein n=1 Tax=Zootermopsis nevadensis TaxID=136037 RepID=A0A067RJX5_ZOONE|nr:hypothetical protein L798_03259 [Zootermopsis nevadensis]